ncbi:site-2 protease family protein [Candidatus Sumerlaeota bacterium]|nr:site-2 protease family protein [Candidatus Sumerlaeota bacterium]
MQNPQYILMLPVLLFSLSFHEFAHALAAWWAGDDTAARMGRLTMNPISHIDPIGTIVVPAICLFQSMAGGGGFFFGWAKPVPVNPGRFRKTIWDVYVSFAGPASNFILVVIFAVIVKILYKTEILYSSRFSREVQDMIYQLAFSFISLNALLGLFNLLPIPPLDGSHIFYHFLVRPHSRDHVLFKIFEIMERYGFILLMALIFAVPVEINPFYLIFNLSMRIVTWFIIL